MATINGSNVSVNVSKPINNGEEQSESKKNFLSEKENNAKQQTVDDFPLVLRRKRWNAATGGVCTNDVDRSSIITLGLNSLRIGNFGENSNRQIKHCQWTLWSHLEGLGRMATDAVEGTELWQKTLKNHGTFESIDEFYKIYAGVPRAGELPPDSDLFGFKEGIRPDWEHSENIYGGRWQGSIKEFEDANKVDDSWERLIEALIQSTLVPSAETKSRLEELICGVSINIRPPGRGHGSKITLWTRYASDAFDDDNRAIGNALAGNTGIKWLFYFVNHDLNQRQGIGYKTEGVHPKLTICPHFHNSTVRCCRQYIGW